MNKGLLVSVEGIDGSGKTTLVERLTEHLSGRVMKTREPTSNAVGAIARSIVDGTVSTRFRGFADGSSPHVLELLFAADRLHHSQSVIEPALKLGACVITDRYLLSGLAYTDVDDKEWVEDLHRFAHLPDLVLFIEVHVDIALDRLSARSGERSTYETLEKQTRVYDRYQEVLALYAGHVRRIVSLNGELPPDELAEEAAKHIKELWT